jgi:hypothetical protein
MKIRTISAVVIGCALAFGTGDARAEVVNRDLYFGPQKPARLRRRHGKNRSAYTSPIWYTPSK